MTDVSLDMTANGFDASESFTLDRSLAEDVIPLADPGVDRSPVSIFPLIPSCRLLWDQMLSSDVSL